MSFYLDLVPKSYFFFLHFGPILSFEFYQEHYSFSFLFFLSPPPPPPARLNVTKLQMAAYR